MIENQYVIVLWEVGYLQLMSETLSVTLSETSRTEKRFGGNENGIISHEGKDNVGVN